jgi:hypothetical protein
MRMTHTGTVTPLGLFGYELANIISVFVAMAAMAKIEKRRFGDYGLKPFRANDEKAVSKAPDGNSRMVPGDGAR